MIYGDFIIRPIRVKALTFTSADEFEKLAKLMELPDFVIDRSGTETELQIKRPDKDIIVKLGHVIALDEEGHIDVYPPEEFFKLYAMI